MRDASTEACWSGDPDWTDGDVRRDDAPTPVGGATWYVADGPGDALVFDLPDGALVGAAALTLDLLVDGEHATVFHLRLREGGDSGRTFRLTYGVLPQCQARVRLPLAVVEGAAWGRHREGAWCQPTPGGDRVDPGACERVEVAVQPLSGRPVRWCQTPLAATDGEPPRLADPALPDGVLVDEFGQSTLHEWEGWTASEAELVDRLQTQRQRAGEYSLPEPVDQWGGWTGREFEATGFFRVDHDGDRWWLVTPDGHPFWSAGLVGVAPAVRTRFDGLEAALSWLPDDGGTFGDARPDRDGGEFVDYHVANLVRAFGLAEWEDAWRDLAFGQLRRFGVNTVGNWSDWTAASEAGVPYVRGLEMAFPGVPDVHGDVPDVFHDDFPAAAEAVASRLEETVGDPAMVGYFLGNQPDLGSADESPAAGMLAATESCATRRELAGWLADRHGDAGLADAWEMDVTLDDVAGGRWDRTLTDAARAELREFSAAMVDRLYGVVSEACRRVDPDHLNLGVRYRGVPEDWLLEGMSHFDVVSANCYRERVSDGFGAVADAADAPVLVGEFHFGALDVGLPAAGVQRVPDQAARGDAYRVYLEDAAAKPWCVGAHHFQLYDQSALGRFDGQAGNVGLLDVCARPYEPLLEAARASHERLYDLATGAVEPYDDPPEYLEHL